MRPWHTRPRPGPTRPRPMRLMTHEAEAHDPRGLRQETHEAEVEARTPEAEAKFGRRQSFEKPKNL